MKKNICPICDETGWGGSPEMFEEYRLWHDAGHPSSKSLLADENKDTTITITILKSTRLGRIKTAIWNFILPPHIRLKIKDNK